MRLNLQTRFVLRLVLIFIGILALAYGIVQFSIRLTTHQYPGLGPDPLSYASLNESKPSTTDLKLLLLPFPDYLFTDAPTSTTLQLENDSTQAVTFDATLTATGSCLVPSSDSLHVETIPAHQTYLLKPKLIPQNCAQVSVPQQLLLGLSYTWTFSKLPGHRKSPPAESPDASRLQLPDSAQANPLTLNLSIHLPGNHPGAHSTPAKPQRSFAGLITLSPIEVSTAHERSVRHFYRIASAIGKDFTWPILLAFLTFSTQAILARRGERQQIFTAMLPVLTKLILEHYVPMARRMQTVATEADKINPASTVLNAPDRTFAAILLMRRRVQHLFNSNGGIFFRSAIGEELFDLCLSGFYRNFQLITGNADDCEKLALALSPQSTLLDAYARIFSPRWSPISAPLFAAFQAWAVAGSTRTAAFNDYLLQLFLAEAVLSFECNRIYYQSSAYAEHATQNWYFDSPTFYFKGNVNSLPASTDKTDILKLYRKYLNIMPTECFGKATYPA